MSSFCHGSSLFGINTSKARSLIFCLFVCLNVKGLSKAEFSYTTVNLFSHLAGISLTKIKFFDSEGLGGGRS